MPANVVDITRADQLEELKQLLTDSQATVTTYRREIELYAAISKQQETAIDNLRSDVDDARGELKKEVAAHIVSKHQHTNCIARVKELGGFK